eukprot:gene2334-2882_t
MNNNQNQIDCTDILELTLNDNSNNNSNDELEENENYNNNYNYHNKISHVPKASNLPPINLNTSERTPRESMTTKALIGQYVIGEILGKGGFATVFKGLNSVTGDFVAIKRFEKSKISRDQQDSISTELELLQRLNHESIVTILGKEENDKYIFLFLEYMENGSLSTILNHFGTFPEPLILVGTPYWIAPEVIEISGHCQVSDIWSVGCTIIELVTGSPPYFHLNPMSAMFRIVQDDKPPFPRNISPDLEDFLSRPSSSSSTAGGSGSSSSPSPTPNPNNHHNSNRDSIELKKAMVENALFKLRIKEMEDENKKLSEKLSEFERKYKETLLSAMHYIYIVESANNVSSNNLLGSNSSSSGSVGGSINMNGNTKNQISKEVSHLRTVMRDQIEIEYLHTFPDDNMVPRFIQRRLTRDTLIHIPKKALETQKRREKEEKKKAEKREKEKLEKEKAEKKEKEKLDKEKEKEKKKQLQQHQSPDNNNNNTINNNNTNTNNNSNSSFNTSAARAAFIGQRTASKQSIQINSEIVAHIAANVKLTPPITPLTTTTPSSNNNVNNNNLNPQKGDFIQAHPFNNHKK